MVRKLTQAEIVDLQTKRKELVLRGIVVLVVLIFATIGLVMLELNKVAWGDSNRFRVMSLVLITGLYGGYIVPFQRYPRLLRDYPEVVRERPWQYSIPTKWHMLRAVILIGSLVLLLSAFVSSNKSQPETVDSSTVNNSYQPTNPAIPSNVEKIIGDAGDTNE